MLRAECYKQRMEKGLSFLEFNYMIMQSYDFYYMFQHYGCNMQFGGDDQWSNMLGGTELIRRKLGKDAYAMTITLLTELPGQEDGQDREAAPSGWTPTRRRPFEFYQYWRNVGDADVLKCIRMLTFLPLEQIDEMDHWEGSQLNQAKEILAYELTKHGPRRGGGREGAGQLPAACSAVPQRPREYAQHEAGRRGCDQGPVAPSACWPPMVAVGSVRLPTVKPASLVQQGGVLVDGEKVTAPDRLF